jgi:large subunit ribosomal protein L21
MYAVIRTGAAQARVEQGQQVQIDLVTDEVGKEITLQPVLIVDGDKVLSTPDALKAASVTAKVVGEVKAAKINAMTYKSKANERKRWGHRQRYTTVEITAITA